MQHFLPVPVQVKMTASTWRILTVFVLFTSATHEVTTAPHGTLETHGDVAVTIRSDNLTLEVVSIPEKGLEQLHNFEANLVEKIEHLINNAWGSTQTQGIDVDGSFFQSCIDYFRNNYQLIYPGTLWCGDKNKAKSYNELGLFKFTDSCCRDHDHCSDFIGPGEARDGLKNPGLFTRFNCSCDQKLYNCFANVDSLPSNVAGFIYFNILTPQCFKMEHPIVLCEAKILGRCVKYRVDSSQDKRLQWFDNSVFISEKIVNLLNY